MQQQLCTTYRYRRQQKSCLFSSSSSINCDKLLFSLQADDVLRIEHTGLYSSAEVIQGSWRDSVSHNYPADSCAANVQQCPYHRDLMF